MFGDIVTDLASVLQGGMGMAVGCNIGDTHGMFEPIHGSAPPLAHKNVANPMAMFLACAEGLKWLGQHHNDQRLIESGVKLERVVAEIVEEGSPLTFDLVGEENAASMSEVTDAVLGKLI